MVSLKKKISIVNKSKKYSAIYKKGTHRYFKMPTAFSRSHFFTSLAFSPILLIFCSFCLFIICNLTLTSFPPYLTKISRHCPTEIIFP